MKHEVGRKRVAGTSRPRFAKKARRQQPAIARASIVEYGYGKVSTKGEVLQAVVTDDEVDIRMMAQQRLCRLSTLAGDKDWDLCLASNKGRFVATGAWRR